MIIKVPETEQYRQLGSDKEKQKYNEAFLETLCCFTYLDEYTDKDLKDIQTINDVLQVNIEPMSKAFFAITFLKSKLQRQKDTNKGTLNGYYDVISENEEALNIIQNVISYRDTHEKKEDFFDK